MKHVINMVLGGYSPTNSLQGESRIEIVHNFLKWGFLESSDLKWDDLTICMLLLQCISQQQWHRIPILHNVQIKFSKGLTNPPSITLNDIMETIPENNTGRTA